MQVNQSAIYIGRFSVAVLLLLCSACQTPEPAPDNRYHRPLDSESSISATTSRPLRQLHNQALAAINESQYGLATDYLQRAIKIEPRNGWSWHYLADINWRQGKYQGCISMLDRADSYAEDDAALISANQQLRGQCQ